MVNLNGCSLPAGLEEEIDSITDIDVAKRGLKNAFKNNKVLCRKYRALQLVIQNQNILIRKLEDSKTPLTLVELCKNTPVSCHSVGNMKNAQAIVKCASCCCRNRRRCYSVLTRYVTNVPLKYIKNAQHRCIYVLHNIKPKDKRSRMTEQSGEQEDSECEAMYFVTDSEDAVTSNPESGDDESVERDNVAHSSKIKLCKINKALKCINNYSKETDNSASEDEESAERRNVVRSRIQNGRIHDAPKYINYCYNEMSNSASEDEDSVERINVARSSKIKNSKINRATNVIKKSHKEIGKSAKSLYKNKFPFKSQKNRSESTHSRRKYNKRPRTARRLETLPDIDNVPAKKTKYELKRKSRELRLGLEEMKDEQEFSNRKKKLKYINFPPTESSDVDELYYKKVLETEMNQKCPIIVLTDILTDPAAENNVYVARYKQSNLFKDNEENEYECVDGIDESDDNEKISENYESDNKSDIDNNKSFIPESTSFKLMSNESNISDSDQNSDVEDNHEQDTTSAGSSTDEDEDVNSKAETPVSNGKRGPRTPPPPSPASCELFRRGPHTPPGTGPDSEVSGRPL